MNVVAEPRAGRRQWIGLAVLGLSRLCQHIRRTQWDMSLHGDDALRPRRWLSAHSGFQRRFSDRLDLDLYPDA